uniref:Epididymal protein 13 n=2 Tax=Rattus norvegicus TaxID=10116 RepID=A0ABK0LIX7_RAT
MKENGRHQRQRDQYSFYSLAHSFPHGLLDSASNLPSSENLACAVCLDDTSTSLVGWASAEDTPGGSQALLTPLSFRIFTSDYTQLFHLDSPLLDAPVSTVLKRLLSLQVLNEETSNCQEEVKPPPATTTARTLVRSSGWNFLRCAYMVMTFLFVSYNKGDWCYCHYCNPDLDLRDDPCCSFQ